MLRAYTDMYENYNSVHFQTVPVCQAEPSNKQVPGIGIAILTSKSQDLVKIVLSSETDIFLYYEATLSKSDVRELSKVHSLNLTDTKQFVEMLQNNIGEVAGKEKKLISEHPSSDNLLLKITKSINHKAFVVLALALRRVDEQQAANLAAFRYGTLRQQIADYEFRIQQTKEAIRARNPYILKFLNKP